MREHRGCQEVLREILEFSGKGIWTRHSQARYVHENLTWWVYTETNKRVSKEDTRYSRTVRGWESKRLCKLD
jgi:hypothetical protein